MYGIGTVARLAQVSVRTLRYYDGLGLLRPIWADPDTGYRWYAPDQLHRLHRIGGCPGSPDGRLEHRLQSAGHLPISIDWNEVYAVECLRLSELGD